MNTAKKINDWPEIIPFDDADSLVEFPVQALPLEGKKMVEKVAEVIQADKGMVAACYIGVLAIALQKKFVVDLNTHPEQLSLYICNVAESGERKSAVFNEMSKPIYIFQRNEKERRYDEIKKSESNNKILTKSLELVENDMSNASNKNKHEELEAKRNRLMDEIKKTPILTESIFAVDDITTEKLGVVMNENKERIGIMSAEGGIFQILAGLYNSKNSNLDLVLKSFSGDPVCCHRIGRGSVNMNRPALSMCLNVQPEVIREIGDVKQFKGKGLVGRFLFWRCKDLAGNRLRQYETIEEELRNAYELHLNELMSIPLEDETKKLELESKAQLIWDNFYNIIEASMKAGGDLCELTDWGSKLAGNVARIAGLLHMAKHGVDGEKTDIEEATMNNACKIGLAYKNHVLFILGMMGEIPEISSAKLTLKYLKSKELTSFTKTDVLRTMNAFKKIADIKLGIPILIERNYIREIEFPITNKPGRPKSKEYEVNPKSYL